MLRVWVGTESLEIKRAGHITAMVCVVAGCTDEVTACWRDGKKLLVSRDSHATVLFAPCGGDVTWTTGALSERRAIG